MQRPVRVLALVLCLTGLLAIPQPAAADPEHDVPGFADRLAQHRGDDPAGPGDDVSVQRHGERASSNLEALGHSFNPASFFHPDLAPP